MTMAPVSVQVLRLALAMALTIVPALSQEPAPALDLELNSLEATDDGCRMTFVISNGLAAEVERAAFEIALFDRRGLVERLTVIDFGNLPEGKTKVSRFDFAGRACKDISRVLVNDVADCGGSSVTAELCARGLRTSTKSEIGFGS